MTASNVHLEGSSFRDFFYFVLISFMSKVCISQFFPPKISSLRFMFPLAYDYAKQHA